MSNENGTSAVRRSKRIALGDISNVVTQSQPQAAERAVKKRKISNGTGHNYNGDLNQGREDTSFSGTVNDSIFSIGEHSMNLSSSSIADKAELHRNGFRQPKVISRTLPLHTKGADPAECIDIIDDMYGFFFVNQKASMPRPEFSCKTEITPRMRTILVDWLLEVHYKYKLFPATLWLCVNILDRFMERTDFLRNQLQLVGITALFIAAKFEEFRAPSVNEFVQLTDSAYHHDEILAMEFTVLEKLNYQLLVPTTYHFLQRYLHRIKAPERTRLLSFFFAERSIQEIDFFSYTPQLFAAAAVYAALQTVLQESSQEGPVWGCALKEESLLDEKDIIDCARLLVFHAGQTPLSSSKRKLEAVKKKYNTKATLYVSQVALPDF